MRGVTLLQPGLKRHALFALGPQLRLRGLQRGFGFGPAGFSGIIGGLDLGLMGLGRLHRPAQL